MRSVSPIVRAPILALGLLAPGLLACSKVEAPMVAPTPVAETTTEPETSEVDLAPRLQVRVTPRLDPPAVAVSIELRGPAQADADLQDWGLAGPIDGPIAVTARDRDGVLATSIEVVDSGLRLHLERAPKPPLTLDYVRDAGAAGLGSLARVELDEAHLFATGEALLFLPERALERRLALVVEVDGGAF
ncbi:MAG: hypothetical protein KC431_30600, partial [Myxococcales bacterium]|nr:hypothetical protein [Myxococcales bacterium]